MKQYFSIMFFFLLVGAVHGQKKEKYSSPVYIGGDKEFIAYIEKYITFPIVCLETNMYEAIPVKIYIDKIGNLGNIETVGKYIPLQNEIKRALRLMPKWNPGRLSGNPIDTSVKIVINFVRLIGDSSYNRLSNKDTVNIIAYQYVYDTKSDSAIFQNKLRIKQRESAYKLLETGKEFAAEKDFKKALEYYNISFKYDDSDKRELYYWRGLSYFNIGENKKACYDWLESYRYGYSYSGELYKKNCSKYQK